MVRLWQAHIGISMTESDDPNENALAERVIRTLKEDFRLWGFPGFDSAATAIDRAIRAYNSVRLHASLNYQTPEEANHQVGLNA